MSVTVEHKRGDTFVQHLLIPDTVFPDGYFLLWDVTSQIRTAKGRLIDNLITSWVNVAADTRWLRLFCESTTAWPIATLEVDVQFTRQSDSFVQSTETLLVDVFRDVTL